MYFRLGQYCQVYKGTTTVSTYADVRLLQKLVSAIKEENISTIRKIIKKGIDINIDLHFEGGNEKMTALHFAASNGLVLATRELLQSKCDLNRATPFDQATPLHLACQVEDNDKAATLVRELLMHGANPNLMDHSGRTALYKAVQMGRLEIAKILLRYGSDSSIVCECDEFPDTIVHMSKQLDLMDSEMQEIYDPYQGNSPLIQACREHYHDIVKEILKSDCDVNYCNSAGNTALHVAAKSESQSTYIDKNLIRFPLSGNVNIVQLLLETGCNMNLMNHQGDTPIKRAVDGIQEIFSWSFTIEDRIEHAIVFCEIVSLLALARCNLELQYHGKSILTTLLEASTIVYQADSLMLETSYVTALLNLLAAGVPPSMDDLHKLSAICSTSPCLFEALAEANEKPASLKRLCKLSVRRYMREPVRKNISILSLPRSLKDYVGLKTNT
jgi:ankyrin repeat protein